MRVLVVDDSPSMRTIVVQMLRTLGCDTVDTAGDGAEALEQLDDHKVDLLLTDCNMPRMSGLELAQRVRERHPSSELPIVMFTTMKSRQDILAAVRAGVNGYLVKPFNVRQLRQQIEKARAPAAPRPTAGAAARLVADRNRKPSIQDPGPLVIIGERISSAAELADPRHQGAARFLATVVQAMDQLNAEFGALDMRFYLESDCAQLARQVRHQRERLKLLLLSGDLGGSASTMARLARINQTSQVGVALVLSAPEQLRRRERDSLQKVGVLVLERTQMDQDFVGRLLREQVVSKAREGVGTAPGPEEIASRIETDISLLTALPVLPLVYHRILKLSRHRYSDMSEWAEAVLTDPVSSAMVIRRANSPLYGFRQHVTDVDKAVTLLGKSTVKELVVTEALRRSFQSVREARFSLEDYWAHSLCTGLVARMLVFPMAREEQDLEQRQEFAGWQLGQETVRLLGELQLRQRLPPGPGDDVFVAGMMHDIGKVALAHCYPGLYPLLLDGMRQAKGQAPMYDVEQEVAGITHAQVGRTLAANWGLDEASCRAVATHHAPDPSDGLTRLVHLANALASAALPYPGSSGHPMVEAVREGSERFLAKEDGQDDPDPMDRFMSSAVLESLELDRAQILQLALVMAPDLVRLVDAIRSAMRD